MHEPDTTIVALATPPGRGGLGCVRLSGNRAHEIAASLFRPARSRKPDPASAENAPVLRFGRFVDSAGCPIDHGFLVTFAEGGSYTGEPSAELWSHGSPAVLGELVRGSLAAGAEAADPGEFTFRAVQHGRLDLARAEAVRDLIAARTLYQARLAFAQAEGALSLRVTDLREELEEWIARGEAAVEFVDESETHLGRNDLSRAIERISALCGELLAGFRRGRVVREGAALALVGLPNVGKSSLFNRLLERDRAIVTEVAGTTRDTLEEELVLDGVPVRLVDTAGLRRVADPVESHGVARAERARREADLVLLVLDGSRELAEEEREILDALDEAPGSAATIVAMNKCDLPGAADRAPARGDAVRVSAKTGEGVERLREAVRESVCGRGALEDPIVTNARHARALEQTLVALHSAARAGQAGLSEELLLEDLKAARGHLASITGEFCSEDLYDRIFSTFCIGK